MEGVSGYFHYISDRKKESQMWVGKFVGETKHLEEYIPIFPVR